MKRFVGRALLAAIDPARRHGSRRGRILHHHRCPLHTTFRRPQRRACPVPKRRIDLRYGHGRGVWACDGRVHHWPER